MQDRFSDIRPYLPEELPEVFRAAMSMPQCVGFFQKFFPNVEVSALEAQLMQMPSSYEFQRHFIMPVLEKLLTIKQATLSERGLDEVGKPALFISNHRDIVIDPAYLNFCLLRKGYDTTEIAIGDNLLAEEWIRVLVRINRSFIVKRSLPKGEQIRAFAELSAYIRYTLTEKQTSIWIAQREGRAKDSNDTTQESLLKMFALSGDAGFVDNLRALNICPVAISYEYDPCDFLKARELQQRRDNPDFRKAPKDDVISMQTGIMGTTGRIQYNFTPTINPHLDAVLAKKLPRNEEVAAVARLIDSQIYAGYEIYPINRFAYDALKGSDFSNVDSDEVRQGVAAYFEAQLNKIDLPNADRPFLKEKLFEMYANPFRNYLHTTQNQS